MTSTSLQSTAASQTEAREYLYEYVNELWELVKQYDQISQESVTPNIYIFFTSP